MLRHPPIREDDIVLCRHHRLPFADLKRPPVRALRIGFDPLLGILHDARPLERQRRADGKADLLRVPRREQRQIRNAQQHGHAEHAVMRLAVVADEADVIRQDADRQVLQTDIVNNLVVCALKKGRVDGKIRPHAAARQTGRHADGMLLCDADVKKAFGIIGRKFAQAGSARHRRRDRDDALVLRRHRDEGLASHLCGAFLAALVALQAIFHAEGRDAVEFLRLALGKIVAIALFRDDVDHHGRVADLLRLLKDMGHLVDVVPVERAEVPEAQRLKQLALRHDGFDHVLGLLDRSGNRPADQRNALQPLLDALLSAIPGGARAQMLEIGGERADVF